MRTQGRRERGQPWRRIWISLHTSAFALAWLFTVGMTVTGRNYGSVIPVIFVLIWTPVFIWHMTAYARQSGRDEASSDEREAYRDGFRDAVRLLGRDGNSDTMLERLGMDEEGELIPLMSGKRKRD